MKQKTLVISASALLITALAGCETREPQEEVRTVDWYVAHETERAAKLAECKSKPGTAHGCDTELHQRQPRRKRGKRGDEMGHRKGGRPDRAADSRSAVSPLRPTEPRSPGAGGPPAFSAPQNSHSVPGPPLYGPTRRAPCAPCGAVARDAVPYAPPVLLRRAIRPMIANPASSIV